MPPTGQYNVFELSTGSVVGFSTATITYASPAPSTAAAITSVIGTTSGATVLQAANAARKGLIAYSCTGSGAPALIAYTTAATTANFTAAVLPGVLWEMPAPQSVLGMSVVVSTANTGSTATLLVTELS